MAWFDENVNAAYFAAEVLGHDEARPGISRSRLGVKVGIERGEVELDGDDIKGDAANIASRVQGFADEDCVYYGPEYRKALIGHWGEAKVEKFTLASKDVQPKGTEPIEIFKLDWKQLDDDQCLRGHRALEGIRRAGLQRYNIEKETLKTGGTIIWPVVPRSLVTAIHRAQLEIIHHLARYCDWTAVLMVADCGGFEISREEAQRFGDAVAREADRIGVKLESIQIMSDWFAGEGASANALRSRFQKLSQKLNVKELSTFQRKLYSPEQQDAAPNKVMDFLRPVLTGAAVLQFAEERKGVPVMVLAGEDEHGQWSKIREFGGNDNWLGTVFNGILKTKDGYYYRQETEGPIWGDEKHCIEEARGTNLLRWLAQHFIVIPSYPAEGRVDGVALKFETWEEETGEPTGGVSGSKLVGAVWEKIRRR